MKKALLFVASIAIGSLLFNFDHAEARDQFKKAFDAKYVKADGSSAEEKEFAEAAKKANCNICHEGANRKNRNDYGKAVNTLLKTSDALNVGKINESLDTVAKMKSDPNNPSSPTWGEIIAKGKLPAAK